MAEQPGANAAAAGAAASNSSPQLASPGSLTAQALQQLEQQVVVVQQQQQQQQRAGATETPAVTGAQAAAAASAQQQTQQQLPPPATEQQPQQSHVANQLHQQQSQHQHQRSPLGPAAGPSRRDSVTSSCSSTALLGQRMSGTSLQRPDFAAAPSHLQQQQAYQQGVAAGVGVLPQQRQLHVGGVVGGGSSSNNSSPPLSPSRHQQQQQQQQQQAAPAAVAQQASAEYIAVHDNAVFASDTGSASMLAAAAAAGAVNTCLPVPPQALGLPAIVTTSTTLPVPIPGTSLPAAGVLSPHAPSSPRAASTRSLNITPQASTANVNATALAMLAATHAHQQQQVQQQQQQQQQQLQVAATVSAGGAAETDDSSLDSSSDDDDNYEFGEQKIKRTFSRQQRRQRRQQQQLAQQQQQQQQQAAAALLLQQQVQLQLLQQQQQAELQAQLLLQQQQQQAASGSQPLSPTSTLGGSPSATPPLAAAAAATGTSLGGAPPVLGGAGGAGGFKSSPPTSPRDVTGSSLGSTQANTLAAAAAVAAAGEVASQQLLSPQRAAEQQAAVLAMLADQQQQQQQPPPAAAALADSTPLLQQSPGITWASVVAQQQQPTAAGGTEPAAAAAAAAASAALAAAEHGGGGGLPPLEHTLSATSVMSGASGRSGKLSRTSQPAGGSAGGAGAAQPTAATAAVAAQAAAQVAAAVQAAQASQAAQAAAAWLKGTSTSAGADGVLPASLGSVQGVAAGGGSVGAQQQLGSCSPLDTCVLSSAPSFALRQQLDAATAAATLAAAAAAVGDGAAANAVNVSEGGGGGGGGGGGSKEQAELKAEFQGLSLFNEEDDDDEGEGEEEHTVWWRRGRVWLRIVAFSLSGLMLLFGLLTHTVPAMSKASDSGVELFRWFYFFAAWPTLFVCVSFLTNKLFSFIEWWFYREALFYLDSVRRTARGLLFMSLTLPWFVVCFWVAWCDSDECQASRTYKQATDVVWKLMVCLTLFTLANFLKSVLTKLLSSHFYKTAHFKKVKQAIEKEYWLLMLSQPRPAPKPAVIEPPLSRLSHFVYYNQPNGGGGYGGGGHGATAPGDMSGQAKDADGSVHDGGSGGGHISRSHSDTGGNGSRFSLRRRNRNSRPSGELPKAGGLMLPHKLFSRRDSSRQQQQQAAPMPPPRSMSCGPLHGTTGLNGAAVAAAGGNGFLPPLPSSSQQSGDATELTLSRHEAANLVLGAAAATATTAGDGGSGGGGGVGASTTNGAACPLSPDFTARILVSGFSIEGPGEGPSHHARSAAVLDSSNASPSAFTAAAAVAPGSAFGPAAAAAAAAAGQGGIRIDSLSTHLRHEPSARPVAGHVQTSAQQQSARQDSSSLLEKSRSSSLRWTQHDTAAATAAAGGSGAAAASEVNLQPFRGVDADRLNMCSGSDDADSSDDKQKPRWGFWKQLTGQGKEGQQQLLPDSHSPSSPTSQHTLTIQDPVKPAAAATGTSPPTATGCESSSPSKNFGKGMLSSMFGGGSTSPTAGPQQQQKLGVSRINSELSSRNKQPGSASVSVQRRSTDAAGARASTAGAGAGAAKEGATGRAATPAEGTAAAAMPSDPLLQPGMLETVNLKVDGKAVDTSTIKPAEWERLRTGIALKTFTALMKRYQDLSDAEEAKKLRDARRFAKGLFYHVRGGGAAVSRPYLVRDDFSPFFTSKDSADAAYGYMDKDNDASITLKEMKDSVAAIFKERKNMAASLKDTDSIVNTLEFGLGFLLHFIFAAIYLLVWGMDIVKGFSTFSATVLALTFVFGNSVRQIFESMLFLFVEHAFDVGDLLEVETVAYRVKKIDLMYTVLVKSTGERCYFPNTRLITLPVVNLTRSCARSEKVVISLNIGAASNAAREALLAAVKQHYEENDADFNSCPSVNFVNMVDPFKVQLSVTWTYNFGADESKRTSVAKTGLLQRIHSTLGCLPCLEYTLVRDPTGRYRADGDSDDERADAAGGVGGGNNLGAGVAEQQVAQVATLGAATLGAAMLGGTAMMGTAGLAMLPVA